MTGSTLKTWNLVWFAIAFTMGFKALIDNIPFMVVWFGWLATLWMYRFITTSD